MTSNFDQKKFFFYCITIILFLLSLKVTAQNDTIFFDEDWKISPKETALYYRIKPLKIKTKDAVGYKIHTTDSLFIIKDYYLMNHKIQFQGYSKDQNAEYLVGKAIWYNEDGEKPFSREFNYKGNNNFTRFRIQKLPIIYADYKIAQKSQFTVGLEFCMECKNENKLFLGVGFGVTSYNNISYGLPDLHLSYNTKNLLFIKGGTSNKHAYVLTGVTAFNMLDLGFGYSQKFNKDELPIIKGLTFGLTFRFADNSQSVYTKIKIM